jgi:hypothetical protein
LLQLRLSNHGMRSVVRRGSEHVVGGVWRQADECARKGGSKICTRSI